jgi:hypothetical protein
MQLLEFVDYHSAAGGRWPTAVGKCSDHPGRADEENQLRPLLERTLPLYKYETWRWYIF